MPRHSLNRPMNSLLDIISITKDDPEGIASTIASTRTLRSCKGVRQIIIDSSDADTQDTIKSLVSAEKNIEYLWQKPSGIAVAFNQGIARSAADWIWFLNGRDTTHLSLDAEFMLRILKASQAEAIIFELQYLQSGVRLKHPPLWSLWPPLWWVPHPATIIRRDLFKQYGMFDNAFKISMDGELWIRFFSKEMTVDMISIPIAVYDQSGSSSIDIRGVKKEVAKIVVGNFGFLLRMWLRRGTYLVKALIHYFTL